MGAETKHPSLSGPPSFLLSLPRPPRSTHFGFAPLRLGETEPLGGLLRGEDRLGRGHVGVLLNTRGATREALIQAHAVFWTETGHEDGHGDQGQGWQTPGQRNWCFPKYLGRLSLGPSGPAPQSLGQVPGEQSDLEGDVEQLHRASDSDGIHAGEGHPVWVLHKEDPVHRHLPKECVWVGEEAPASRNKALAVVCTPSISWGRAPAVLKGCRP